MTVQRIPAKLSKSMEYLLYLVLFLMPFHAFFTTWIASASGNVLQIRAWKEVALFVLTITGLYLCARSSALKDKIVKNKLALPMLAFVLWTLLVALLFDRQPKSTLLGLTIQLRFVVIFFFVFVVGSLHRSSPAFLEKLLLVPAIGVIVFGLAQMFALPYDFLKHFGYRKSQTIPPYFTIDEQLSKLRYASTLRGPNPLGTYLIVPLTTLANMLWQRRRKLVHTVLFVGGAILLYGSQSRGAWIGFLAAAAAFGFVKLSHRARALLVVVLLLGGLIGGGMLYTFRQTSFVQDVILHDNPKTGGKVSSNAGHLDSLKTALRDVKKRPLFGCGPGCAGPASVYAKSGARYAENYFLQTAQELGIVGLTLLLLIYAIIAHQLLLAKERSSQVLFVVFIGVNVASLFSHAWADDTIAYIWWGLAGLVLAQSHTGYQNE